MVSLGVRDVTLVTHICSHSAECLFANFCNQTWHHHEQECHAKKKKKKKKKRDSIFKVEVIVWAYIIEI